MPGTSNKIIERLVELPHPTMITIDLISRFYSKMLISDQLHPRLGTVCHNWVAYKTKSGELEYGRFSLKGYCYLASRVAWWLHHRQDPGKNLVLHHCDNSICVNVEHLYLGNHRQNQIDAIDRGRLSLDHRGTKNTRAILTENDIRFIRASPLSKTELAKRFHTTPKYIYDIKKRFCWEHIT